MAQSKLDRILAAEARADELKAAKVKAKITRIENEQRMASDLDAQQLKENKDTSFDEWYIGFVSLPIAVAMYDGIMGTGYSAAMVAAFVAFPVWYQVIIGAIVAFKILALRAMFRWAVRLYIAHKTGKSVTETMDKNVSLTGAKKDIEESK